MITSIVMLLYPLFFMAAAWVFLFFTVKTAIKAALREYDREKQMRDANDF